MRTTLLALLALLWMLSPIAAQNLQLHYDPRGSIHGELETGNYITTTFEMFKPDKWGATFMFVDMDYNQTKGNIGLAYWEIARTIKMWEPPIGVHIEYNGGVGNNAGFGFSIPNAYLVGASYSTQLGSLGMASYLAYKYHAFEHASHDIQWTVSWMALLFNNKITLSGFMDVWTENKDRTQGGSGKKTVLLTEPQVWYNLTPHLALGSEIEMSYNFYSVGYHPHKLYVMPTLAAKWTF